MNRREMLIRLGCLSLAAPLLGCTREATQEAAEEQTQAEKIVEFLFVQSAHGATLADGVLRLSGVSPATIYFSDRPERIAGHVPTDKLLGHLGTGVGGFKADPPNATLSILTGPEPQEIVVVLRDPRMEGNDLVYNVDVLEGKETASGGACSLFIDTIGRPMSPHSVAGHRRRVRRRHIR
jgi:hypothetical protein